MRQVKADLQNHLGTGNRESIKVMSRYGFDSIVDKISERLGPGGVMGLINFDDFRYEQFVLLDEERYERINLGNSVYVPEKDILIVKGEEIPMKDNGDEVHCLVLGTSSGINIEVGMNIEDTLHKAMSIGGIIVLDHPMYRLGLLLHLQDQPDRMRQVLLATDAIEVHNGVSLLPIPPYYGFRANKEAQEFYDRIKDEFPHLGGLISSDGHSVREIGGSYTWIEMPNDYKTLDSALDVEVALRHAVRKSRYPDGKRTNSMLGAMSHLIGVLREDGLLESIKKYGIKFSKGNR